MLKFRNSLAAAFTGRLKDLDDGALNGRSPCKLQQDGGDRHSRGVRRNQQPTLSSFTGVYERGANASFGFLVQIAAAVD